MKLRYVLFLVYGAIIFSLWATLEQSSAQGPSSSVEERKEEAWRKRVEIYKRHLKELKEHPDVFGAIPTEKGIVIITDRPTTVPTQIEGEPVIIKAPPKRLPPPPGVILLKPDGSYEERPDLGECPPRVF